MHAKLLHRSPRGVTLTDAGKRFYERARDVLSRLQQAVDEVDRDEESISASLRITAPMTFGTQYLGPLLFAFMQKHPGMELTLALDDRYLDLLSGGFDLGVRIGRLHDSSLMARAIAASPCVLCCSPDYAERHGVPVSVEDILAHDCVCYGDASVAPYWQFETGGKPLQIAVHGRLHLNNGESMRDAAIAGLGLAALPRFIAAPALDDGRLIEVLAKTPPTSDTIYAIYPRTRYVSRGVRAIIDMLVKAFGNDTAWDGSEPGNKIKATRTKY